MKCICCQDWDFPGASDEDTHNWEICPNCDFPVKFTGWIEHLQNEITNLETENNSLHKKLTFMMRQG